MNCSLITLVFWCNVLVWAALVSSIFLWVSAGILTWSCVQTAAAAQLINVVVLQLRCWACRWRWVAALQVVLVGSGVRRWRVVAAGGGE